MEKGVFTKQSLVKAGWGERLRNERRRQLHTQIQFAEACGIGSVTYQQYETEKRELRLGFLNKLDELGLDVRYILFGEMPNLKNTKNNSQRGK